MNSQHTVHFIEMWSGERQPLDWIVQSVFFFGFVCLAFGVRNLTQKKKNEERESARKRENEETHNETELFNHFMNWTFYGIGRFARLDPLEPTYRVI